MREYNIAVLKGDGIGPEIVDEAIRVLDKAGEKFGVEWQRKGVHAKPLLWMAGYDHYTTNPGKRG